MKAAVLFLLLCCSALAQPSLGDPSAGCFNFPTGDPTLVGLLVWYKGTTLVPSANGTPIFNWSDSSGNQNNANQTTPALRPLVTNVVFANNATGALFNSFALDVTNITSQTNNYQVFITYLAFDTGLGLDERLMDTTSTNGRMLLWHDDNNNHTGSYDGNTINTFGTTQTGLHLLQYILNSSAGQVSRDGSVLGSYTSLKTSLGVGGVGSQTVDLGASVGDAGQFFIGDLFEMRIYVDSGQLGPSTVKTITNSMKAYVGLP